MSTNESSSPREGRLLGVVGAQRTLDYVVSSLIGLADIVVADAERLDAER